MRYTLILSRGGAFAVAAGAVAGTALVFAAGLLVGAAAAVPDEPPLALAAVDSAGAAGARADTAAAESAAALDAMEIPAFADCAEPRAAAVSWSTWTGGGGQMAPLRAVDLPGYRAGQAARVRSLALPGYTGGPDPYAADDSDGQTLGTFSDETQAVALMDRVTDGGAESFIDARLGPDGVPVFRVRVGDPEEAP